jgi:hypothetical protein
MVFSSGGDKSMHSQTSLKMRLKIYLRRECYIWVCRRGDAAVNFGWVLSYRKDDSVLFKDDEHRGPIPIPVEEIESCGAV